MDEKTYTESEISKIIGQAARLQAVEGIWGREGLTLKELKAVAAEAGIDTKFIDIALAASSDHRKFYRGIPIGISRSMFVRGMLTENLWNQMIQHFVHEFGGPGTIEVQNTRRSWVQGPVRFTVDQSGDQILLNAESDWASDLEMPVAFSLVGAIATVVMGILALVSMEWTIGVGALLMAALVVSLFSTYRSKKKLQQNHTSEQFESALNHCAVLLVENKESSLLNTSDAVEASVGRIDLAFDEDTQSSTEDFAPIQSKKQSTST